MKKRIFIALHYLELGGVERSLIGLLQAFDPLCFQVDLFLYDHRGELINQIPSYVNLLPPISAYTVIERPITEAFKKGHWKIGLVRLWLKLKRYFIKNDSGKQDYTIFHEIGKSLTSVLPSLHHFGTYDLAISFLTPHHIVANKVMASVKMAWIHTDYSTIYVNPKKEIEVWSRFDMIAAVSEQVLLGFGKVFPQLVHKIKVIENILSPDIVIQQAKAFSVQEEILKIPNFWRIVSVGRFTYAKNFDNVPLIAKKLLKRGLKFRWYLIGYGSEENKIKEQITSQGVEDYVIILGKKENPYPYIAECDIYVQPSRYEGKAVTVREAQILGKPVVITDYPTSASQVENGVDGFIFSLNNDVFSDELYKLLLNADKIDKIKKNCLQREYGNVEEVKKVYECLKN